MEEIYFDILPYELKALIQLYLTKNEIINYCKVIGECDKYVFNGDIFMYFKGITKKKYWELFYSLFSKDWKIIIDYKLWSTGQSSDLLDKYGLIVDESGLIVDKAEFKPKNETYIEQYLYLLNSTNIVEEILKNRLDAIAYLISNNTDINKQYDNYGETALTIASSNGNLDIVKYLVEKGADINGQTRYGNTPLISASMNGHSNIVKYLIKPSGFLKLSSKKITIVGANVNIQNNNGYTPLMKASDEKNLDIVKYLIKNGADVNIQSNEGETVLILASSIGYLDIVKYLVKNGADINIKNNENETALDIALDRGYEEIAEYLNKKALI